MKRTFTKGSALLLAFLIVLGLGFAAFGPAPSRAEDEPAAEGSEPATVPAEEAAPAKVKTEQTQKPAAAAAAVVLLEAGDPELTITKVEALPTTFADKDEIITITYTVENTGDVELIDVSVTETKPGVTTPTLTVPPPPAPVTTITLPPVNPTDPDDPTGKATFTATYKTTQDDLDCGYVKFSATAVGKMQDGTPVASEPKDARIDVTKLSFAAVASPATFTGAGQTITLTYTVTNTGTVTLFDLTGSQTVPTAEAITFAATPLASGASVFGTVKYTTTQADVDAASANASYTIAFSATASGKTKDDLPVTSPPATASATPQSSVSLTVAAKPTSFKAKDEPITITYTVKNTGKIAISSLAGSQTAPTGEKITFSKNSLAPGDTATGTVSKYPATDADVKAKKIAIAGTVEVASVTPPLAKAATATATVTQPSTDASLRSVLGHSVQASNQKGTQADPKTATVSVPNSTSKLKRADWTPNNTKASVDFGNSWSTLDNKEMSLDVGNNAVCARVTSEAGDNLFYRVTITRASASGNTSTGGSSSSSGSRSSGAPLATTLAVDGSTIRATVDDGGGLLLPFTAKLLDNSGDTVSIDPPAFGEVSHIVLEIPDSWFDSTGHYRRFHIAGFGLLEINDRMRGDVPPSQSMVRIIVRQNPLGVFFEQGGAPLAWDNRRDPMVVGVPYSLWTGELAFDAALYRSGGPGDSRRIAPCSWYKDGMVFGYVPPNAYYAAALLPADPAATDAGGDTDTAIPAILARGILRRPEAGAPDPDRPISRAEYVGALMRALDAEPDGGWKPKPPSGIPKDLREAPDALALPVLQAAALGIVSLNETDAFRPDDPIVRQDMLTMAWSALRALHTLPEYDPSSPQYQVIAFGDWDQVEDAAREPIQGLALLRVVGGTELRPQDQATWGEAARLLAEMLRYGEIAFTLR